VADERPVSTPELVRGIAQAMGVPVRLVKVPVPWLRFGAACVGHAAKAQRITGSLEVETTAFRTRFHWTPPVSFARGMAAAFGSGAPL
jgi:UDP-glucose 4-epimerase